ncbi:MAG: hypothetical protein EBV40_01105, partial [Actinobacteria bacterium]|nr:hypothetical protein [Actinomycetota bacterium]
GYHHEHSKDNPSKQTAHLLPHEAFDSVSKQARAVIGLASSGPKVGDVADLMLIPAGSIREAIANTPPRKLVFYKGRIVSSRLATSD